MVASCDCWETRSYECQVALHIEMDAPYGGDDGLASKTQEGETNPAQG